MNQSVWECISGWPVGDDRQLPAGKIAFHSAFVA